MTPKLPLEQQQHQKGEEELTGSDLSTLWHVRDVGSCPYWFLGVGDAEEVTEDFSDPTENCRRPGDENFRFRVKVVQLTLESGLGHQTLPLLLAESSLALEAHDWSSRLHLNSALTLEVSMSVMCRAVRIHSTHYLICITVFELRFNTQLFL